MLINFVTRKLSATTKKILKSEEMKLWILKDDDKLVLYGYNGHIVIKVPFSNDEITERYTPLRVVGFKTQRLCTVIEMVVDESRRKSVVINIERYFNTEANKDQMIKMPNFKDDYNNAYVILYEMLTHGYLPLTYAINPHYVTLMSEVLGMNYMWRPNTGGKDQEIWRFYFGKDSEPSGAVMYLEIEPKS